MGDPERLVALVSRGTSTIGEVLAARVAQTPESPFIIHEARHWTYAAAWEASRRFAGFLAALGLIGGRVATFLPKCPEALFTWFGANISRNAYVALNRGHRGDVLRDLMQRAGAGILVTDQAGWELPNAPYRAGPGRGRESRRGPSPSCQGSRTGPSWTSAEARHHRLQRRLLKVHPHTRWGGAGSRYRWLERWS